MVRLVYMHGLVGAVMLLGWMTASHLRHGGLIILRLGWLTIFKGWGYEFG